MESEHKKEILPKVSSDKERLGKVIKDMLHRYRKVFLVYFGMLFLFGGSCFLYRYDMEPVWYTMTISLFVGAILFGLRLFRGYNEATRRESLIKSVDSVWRSLPAPETLAEEDYQTMIQILGEKLTDLTVLRSSEKRELVDYYTVWVHQIKTPIAVMRLLLDDEDSDKGRALSTELFRIEQYVEMALNYTRLDSESNDLVIQEYALNDLIRQTIRKYAGQFIYRKLRLNYEPTDLKVVTDQKWFACVLEQLLSNAVKYTPSGSVTISVTGDRRLIVKDTGIGIDPADLPRIFEKGFTGMNGRKETKSTGLGLYLCKKAADKLGIGLSVESMPGEGTTFILDMVKLDNENLFD